MFVKKQLVTQNNSLNTFFGKPFLSPICYISLQNNALLSNVRAAAKPFAQCFCQLFRIRQFVPLLADKGNHTAAATGRFSVQGHLR